MLKTIAVFALLSSTLGGCALLRSGGNSCDDYDGPTPFLNANSNDSVYQEVAVESYLYAQMAANSYNRDYWFALPDSISAGPPVDRGHGFQAMVFEIRSGGKTTQVVIAFRGTDERGDWPGGNFGTRQLGLAEQLFEEVRDTYRDQQVKIVTVGHSLGGALALQISMNYPDVDTYVFNSSYRYRWHGVSYDQNYRIGVAETGDIAQTIRWVLGNPDILHHPHYRCTSRGNHSINRLSRCLTHIAAISSSGAVESLARIGWDPVCRPASSAVLLGIHRQRVGH